MANHRVDINGPVGKLECIEGAPTAGNRAITVVVCHPHPLHEGTMHNKVVHTIAKVCQSLGCHSMRFNYRGVGDSAGVFGGGDGEVEDLKAVVNWVRQQRPGDALWLAGFSFGAYVSIRASQLWPVEQLISVAAPVGHPYFIDIPKVACPWVFVQGADDDVVSLGEVEAWVTCLENKPHLIKVPACGHFFHKNIVVLRDILLKELQ